MHTKQTEMRCEVWEGDESLVAVFTASCPHARSARFPEAIASARQSH